MLLNFNKQRVHSSGMMLDQYIMKFISEQTILNFIEHAH